MNKYLRKIIDGIIAFEKGSAGIITGAGEVGQTLGIPGSHKVVGYGQNLENQWGQWQSEEGRASNINRVIEHLPGEMLFGSPLAKGANKANRAIKAIAAVEALRSGVQPHMDANAIERVNKDIASKTDFNRAEGFFGNQNKYNNNPGDEDPLSTAARSWHSIFTSGADRFGAAGIGSDILQGIGQTRTQRETDNFLGKPKRSWVDKSTLPNYIETAIGAGSKIMDLPGAVDTAAGFAGEVGANALPKAIAPINGEDSLAAIQKLRDKRKKVLGY